MSTPTKLPEWASDETGIVEPSEGRKDTGWETEQQPPAQYFNWWWNLVYKWFTWLWSNYIEVSEALGTTAPALGADHGSPSHLVLLGLARHGLANAEVETFGLTSGQLYAGLRVNTSGAHVYVGAAGSIVTSDAFAESQAARTAAAAYADIFYCCSENSVAPSTAGRIVIAGENGEIQVADTTDLTTWVHKTAAASYAGDFLGAASGPTAFVLVGTSAEIQTSSGSGNTWTHRTPATFSGDFHGVVWCSGLSLFVAIGETGLGDPEIQTSPDGINWTHRTAAVGGGPCRGICTDGTRLLVTDSLEKIQYSDNGIDWFLADNPPDVGSSNARPYYQQGAWYVFGADGRVGVSADRLNWAVVTMSHQSLSGVTYRAGIPIGPTLGDAAPQRFAVIGPTTSCLRTWGY